MLRPHGADTDYDLTLLDYISMEMLYLLAQCPCNAQSQHRNLFLNKIIAVRQVCNLPLFCSTVEIKAFLPGPTDVEVNFSLFALSVSNIIATATLCDI